MSSTSGDPKMNFVSQFLQLAMVVYVISIGFGMIVAQGRGVGAVNRFWMRSIRSIIRGAFRLIARFFNWVASLF